MKVKLQIKNRLTGSLLFEYEKENNTIKDTVLEAIKSNANLRYANLSSADLRYANLRSADLSSADLSYADLRYANLRSANLRSADLSSANLSSADLRSADLSSADLSYADLRSADLSYADLRSANLRSANLSSADLRSADLRSTDLSYANLRSTKNANLVIAMTRIIPEGDIIGYKKCKNDIIVKLLIPKEARRNNAFGRKCRAEYADVIEIFGAEKAYSGHDESVIYEVGKRVFPKEPFNEDFTIECASGIHFYITREEAENN